VSDTFVAYVGPANLHDGTILAVEHGGAKGTVRIRGGDGLEYRLCFDDVCAVRTHRAEGMTLYAVAELVAAGPVRRFAFTNWDDADDAHLEIGRAASRSGGDLCHSGGKKLAREPNPLELSIAAEATTVLPICYPRRAMPTI
jgi:hypothetical protein